MGEDKEINHSINNTEKTDSVRLDEEASIRQPLYENPEQDMIEGFLRQQRPYEKITNDEQRAYELHNCIIINGGGLDNTVINSGVINGNINQDFYPDSKEPQNNNFNLARKQDFDIFMKHYNRTNTLASMIILSILETVPENLLFDLIHALNQLLYPSEEVKKDPDTAGTMPVFESMENLLEVLKAIRVEAIFKSKAGNIPIYCIVFKDETLNKKICNFLWNDYVAMRSMVLCQEKVQVKTGNIFPTYVN